MVRMRKYIEADVLSEARVRINHIYDTHDTVAVCFSGGKDSLAVLNLTHEIAQQRGIEKIPVIFRDEELIMNVVIDFVLEYAKKPWVDMYYFCIPLLSSRFVLGDTKTYIQWDPNRTWIRPKPDIALSLLPGEEGKVMDQWNTDDYIADRCGFKGKIAYITGIRAAESLLRYQSAMAKLNYNYINASSSPRVSLCKPLFDWEENDIFKYFHDYGIEYCQIYDRQLWAGALLRVATPLVSEGAKHLDKLRAYDPVLYQQCMDLFPEMAIQARYHKEAKTDRTAIIEKYGHSFKGVREYIDAYITEEKWHQLALKVLKKVSISRVNSPGSYPPDFVLKQFISGGYKKAIMALPVSQRPKKKLKKHAQ